MNISEWLKKFKDSWLANDVDAVLALFSKEVVYYENPFLKLNSFSQLRKEWEAIRDQDDIYLDIVLFSSDGNKHSAIWHLGYDTNKSNTIRELSGTYLIELDEQGLCVYFHHAGEVKH